MRCKKHPSDLSSSLGVCASCLRERLFALMAAQAQHQAQLASPAPPPDDNNKSDSHRPPPLMFPRSVSPYVTRRKSDDPSPFPSSSWTQSHPNLLFYSTPQVGPTYNSSSAGTTTHFATAASPHRRKHRSRLSLFSHLFRSRSEKFHPDPTVRSRDSNDPASASPSWFSAFFSARRKKQSRTVCTEYPSTAAAPNPRRRADRGMSPESNEECEDFDRSPSASGYSSSESSHGWKKTPVRGTASVRRGTAGVHARNLSGLAFCLSPLVRASPNRHWNQKGGLPPDTGISGDLRTQTKPHLSTAASYCANRSRKLADFGRANHNRRDR